MDESSSLHKEECKEMSREAGRNAWRRWDGEQGGKPREKAGRTQWFEVPSATESSVHTHPPRPPLPQQAWAVAHRKWYM